MEQKVQSGEISMTDIEKTMVGVFTTSLGKSTVDECKFAYKGFDSIKEHLEETVEIIKHLKPIYNLKDDTKKKRW